MEKTKKKNPLVGNLIRFGLSGVLLWFIFSKIDTKKMLGIVSQANWGILAVAFLLFIFLNLVIMGRWMILMRAVDLTIPFFKSVRYYFFGLFGNLFLPGAIGGDIIKVVGLCRDNDQKAKVVASVILDRMSGFCSIVIVAVTTFVFVYRFIPDISLLISVGILAGVSLLTAIFLLHEKFYSFVCGIFNGFPKIKDALMKLHYDLALLKQKPMEGVKAIAIGMSTQLILASVFYLVGRSLNQDIPLFYFIIFVPLICVAAAFPSIGGLGVREAGAAYLFAKVGVDTSVSVSISLINFLFMVLIGLLGGLFFMLTSSENEVRQLKEAGA
jgi:uncharacterized protein (TIRG00374 family)